MKYVVLGGAGAMGRITVRDLVETCPAGDEIVVADYDFAKARTVSAAMRDRRVTPARVNVRDRAATVRALRGTFVLINSVQYQLNLDVMETALALRCTTWTWAASST